MCGTRYAHNGVRENKVLKQNINFVGKRGGEIIREVGRSTGPRKKI